MSDGKLLYPGQQLDLQSGAAWPYTRRMVDTATARGLQGQADTEIRPNDRDSFEVTEFDLEAITEFYYDLDPVSFPDTEDIDFPPVLDSVTAVFNKTSGDGSTNFPVSQQGFAITNSGSGSLNPRANAQASAVIVPDIQPVIKRVYGRNLPVMRYAFYLPGNISSEQILARAGLIANTPTTVTISTATNFITWNLHGLANGDGVTFETTGTLPTGITARAFYYVVNRTANTFQISLTSGGAAIDLTGTQSGVQTASAALKSWPVFRPASIAYTKRGQHVSVVQGAESRASLAFSEDSQTLAFEYGDNASRENGASIQSERIEETLHGIITVADQDGSATIDGNNALVDTKTATVTVAANTMALQKNGVTVISAIVNAPGSITLTATAGVSPAVTPATTPASIPTSGKYLYKPRIQPGPFNHSYVIATVLDFTNVALT